MLEYLRAQVTTCKAVIKANEHPAYTLRGVRGRGVNKVHIGLQFDINSHILSLVSVVHHGELQNFLITSRNARKSVKSLHELRCRY